MPDSQQSFYEKVENLKGKKLALYVIPLFILFVFVGFAIGNVMQGRLGKSEDINLETIENTSQNESVSYKGKVVYVDPNFYPHDEISYYLEDAEGNTVILLKTDDQKLAVVEGLYVVVFGDVEDTKDGQEQYLQVEKVVVKK